MKKYLLIIIPLLLFIEVTAYASQLPDFPFVFVQGDAKTEVPPNIATVSFQVKEFDESAGMALEVVRKRSAELIEFFAEKKIKKEDIVAYEIDKTAKRETKEYKELKILGYEIRRRISIKIRDLRQYEQIVKKLLYTKNVMNIKSDFDRTDRKEIEKELIAEASRKAREQAEHMAKGFGVKVGSVFAISQRSFQRLAAQFEFAGSFSRGMAEIASVEKEFLFVPSTITLRNNIKAIFKLKRE